MFAPAWAGNDDLMQSTLGVFFLKQIMTYQDGMFYAVPPAVWTGLAMALLPTTSMLRLCLGARLSCQSNPDPCCARAMRQGSSLKTRAGAAARGRLRGAAEPLIASCSFRGCLTAV